MAAAAAHARGLIDQDPAVLQRAAGPLRGHAGPGRRAGGRRERLDPGGAIRAWPRPCSARPTPCTKSSATPTTWPGYDPACGPPAPGSGTGPTRTTPAFGWDSLTDTERQVTGLVAQGLSNRQVANRVFLSTHTVAFHLRHLFWKLGITSRVQLARIAAEQGAEDASQRSAG